MTQFSFTKMHGLGNDFVVINCIDQSVSLNSDQVKFIANRRFGVGCDQLLLVEKSNVENADFRYRIFNADGSEVEQCGNGARCFAIFVRDEGLTNKTVIPVITQTGRITLEIKADNQVTVNMGIPVLKPEQIPFVPDDIASKEFKIHEHTFNGEKIRFSAISMGNPHAVIIVDDIDAAPVDTLGKAIQQDSIFPNSVNVGFMQVLDPQNAKLRVFERGVGETQACGTGACAAVVAGQLQGLLEETANIKLLGGNLSISWAGDKNPVMMTGETASVFKGTITV